MTLAPLDWTTDPAGIPGDVTTVDWNDLHARFIAPVLHTDARRQTLDPPARPLLDWISEQDRIVLTGVKVSADTLFQLYGYLAEPCYRQAVPLTVVADRDLHAIDDLTAADADAGFPWSLQRLQHLAARPGPPPSWPAAQPTVTLDDSQRAAVSAHDGVVQVIAPAGSGKTTVLIARVGELLARGVPAGRILCTTFNREARVEMQARLLAASNGDVRAQTFHSVGFEILKGCGGLRRGGVRTLGLGQWRRLCAMAASAGTDHEWVEPPLARDLVAAIKLGLLQTPDEYRPPANDATAQTAATIYKLYEQELAKQDVNDFDDLIFLSLRRLQSDEQLREQWQARYDHVLVDEYQDIDPAQEMIVRILAAPQDGLFCVGDDDQVLYSWRRASVERIVGLDRTYPGLQRVALDHNYRCPPEVVQRSRQVIENNRYRFPKTILHSDQREVADDPRPVIHQAYPDPETAAGDVARKLSVSERGQIVVLARTSRLLRMCAQACVPLGVKISAPDNVFEPAGARAALEAYARLLGDPTTARPEDVVAVFRSPGRGLPFGAEDDVADSLASGRSFEQATGRLSGVAEHARRRVTDGARVLDAAMRLAGDAAQCITYLRGPGGLDKHFAEYEDLTGGTEKVELEVLADAVSAAKGMTMAQYAQKLTAESDALRAIRDEQDGVELTTVHRAKGRQWPTVIVFGCDEEQLPHKAALEEQRAGDRDALEAERRIAYVAFTRAQQRLVILTSTGKQSRFCVEAGVVQAAPKPKPQPRPAAQERFRQRDGYTSQMRAQRSGVTSFDVARRAMAQPGADPQSVLRSCRNTRTAMRVLALTVRAGDSEAVASLTVAEACELLHDVASRRDDEIELNPPYADRLISDLSRVERREVSEALKPRSG